MPGDTSHALLLGRLAQEGEAALAVVAVASTAFASLGGGSGAVAVGEHRVWLAQPQLLGGASVASVPRADVSAAALREHRGLAGTSLRLELVVGGNRLRWRVVGARADAEAVVAALTTPP